MTSKSLHGRLQEASWIQWAGTWVRTFLAVGCSVILVRLLGAELFGRASFVLSIVAYVSLFFSMGISVPFVASLTRYRVAGAVEERDAILGRVLKIRLLMCGLVFVIWWIAHNSLPEQAGKTLIAPLLIWIPALTLVSYLVGTLSRFLVAQYDIRFVTALSLLETILKVALTLAFGGRHPGAGDLLAAATVAEAMIFGLALWRVVAQHGYRLRRSIPKSVASTGILIREGFRPYLLSLLLRILGREVDVLLLGVLNGPVAVTLYVLSFNMARLSIALTGGAIDGTTSLCAFTELCNDGQKERGRKLLQTFVEFWVLLVVPVMVGGMFLGDSILYLLYADAAEGIGTTVPWLFLGVGLLHLSESLKDALQGFGHHGSTLVCHGIGGGINLLASLLWIPQHGAAGAAAGTVFGTAVSVITQVVLLRRVLGLSLHTRTLLASGSGILVMSALLFISNSGAETLSAILTRVLFAGSAYLVVLGLIGPRTNLGRAVRLPGMAGRVLCRVL